jgi:hypothetical protein
VRCTAVHSYFTSGDSRLTAPAKKTPFTICKNQLSANMNTKKSSTEPKNLILHPPGIELKDHKLVFESSQGFWVLTPGPAQSRSWEALILPLNHCEEVLEVKVDHEAREDVQSADLSKAIVSVSAISAYKSYVLNLPHSKRRGATQISIGSMPIESKLRKTEI